MSTLADLKTNAKILSQQIENPCLSHLKDKKTAQLNATQAEIDALEALNPPVAITPEIEAAALEEPDEAATDERMVGDFFKPLAQSVDRPAVDTLDPVGPATEQA